MKTCSYNAYFSPATIGARHPLRAATGYRNKPLSIAMECGSPPTDLWRMSSSSAKGRLAVGWQNGKFRSSDRSEEHTSELQSHSDLVCRLLLEKKKKKINIRI